MNNNDCNSAGGNGYSHPVPEGHKTAAEHASNMANPKHSDPQVQAEADRQKAAR